MMTARGIIDILIKSDKIVYELSDGANGALAGISGLFHAVLGVGLVLIFVSWLFNKKTNKKEEQNL